MGESSNNKHAFWAQQYSLWNREANNHVMEMLLDGVGKESFEKAIDIMDNYHLRLSFYYNNTFLGSSKKGINLI